MHIPHPGCMHTQWLILLMSQLNEAQQAIEACNKASQLNGAELQVSIRFCMRMLISCVCICYYILYIHSC